MREAQPSPVRQRQLRFPVDEQAVRLSGEAHHRCRQLLVQLLRLVLQSERAPGGDDE